MQVIRAIRENLIISLLALTYIIANMVLSFQGIYYFNLLPVFLLIIMLAFTRLDLIYFLIIITTPVSINLIRLVPSSTFSFYIPTEPLMFGVMLIVIYKMAKGGYVDKAIIKHPVTLAILFNLFWILFTSLTSTMPIVSMKFFIARIWFIITFYFLAIYIFRNTDRIKTMIWCYTLSMVVVIFYSINRHLGYGLFDKQAAHFVMVPFFPDHTSYGAILAMIIFPFIGINWYKGQSLLRKLVIGVVFIIVLTALVLSYTRAAWISVIVSVIIMLLTVLKVKFKYLILAGIVALGYLYTNRVSLIHRLEKNEQESSANLAEHVQSISNIATDASNLERINRWVSAYGMWKEKPIVGWGPGTYSFKYAPFQVSRRKTYISTNFGNMGNAHSEYIGPLAESGVLGTVSFILIPIFSLLTGFRVYRRIHNTKIKVIVLTVILGLCTYILHGALNNFLDTDKASALFWGYIAFVVALDIYYKENKDPEVIFEGLAEKS